MVSNSCSQSICVVGLFLSGCVQTSHAATPPIENGEKPAATPTPPTTNADNPAAAGAAAQPELEVLTALRKRRTELDERERMLVAREKAIELLEQGARREVERLLATVERYERCAGVASPTAVASVDPRVPLLLATLRSLSPRKAAPLLAAADAVVLRGVLAALGQEKTGALLAQLEPVEATRVLAILEPPAVRLPVPVAEAGASSGAGSQTKTVTTKAKRRASR